MSGFEVDHGQLAKAGQEISRHGEGTQEIRSKVSDANVSPKSWGLLGLTALFPIYLEFLQNLEQHLDQMQQHLGETGDALAETARAYQELEEEIEQQLQDIIRELDEGSSATPKTPLNSSSAPSNPEILT